jgi:hypothetical protein
MFPHIIEDATEFSFIFRHGPFLLCYVYIYTFYFTFLFLLHFFVSAVVAIVAIRA